MKLISCFGLYFLKATHSELYFTWSSSKSQNTENHTVLGKEKVTYFNKMVIQHILKIQSAFHKSVITWIVNF